MQQEDKNTRFRITPEAKRWNVSDELASEMSSIKDAAKANSTFMKTPNGEKTNLNERNWLLVRTKAFKDWFSDWEKTARIMKLRESASLSFSGNEYIGKYELNSKSAGSYIINSLRGDYMNKDTGELIHISRKSQENITHLKSVFYIPDMIENAIFIDELTNEKGNNKYDSYKYYVVGINIGGEDYTAKLSIGIKNGETYYDHSLTQIEKNSLLQQRDLVKAQVYDEETDLSAVKDKRLVSILQTNSSKIVDENGEPMVVYHGTAQDFNSFDKERIGSGSGKAKLGAGFYFTNVEREAGSYGKPMQLFLSITNPTEVGFYSENIPKEQRQQ